MIDLKCYNIILNDKNYEISKEKIILKVLLFIDWLKIILLVIFQMYIKNTIIEIGKYASNKYLLIC